VPGRIFRHLGEKRARHERRLAAMPDGSVRSCGECLGLIEISERPGIGSVLDSRDIGPIGQTAVQHADTETGSGAVDTGDDVAIGEA